MNAKRRTATATKTPESTTPVLGRKGPFGNILQDDPYTANIQSLLRKAKSPEEAERQQNEQVDKVSNRLAVLVSLCDGAEYEIRRGDFVVGCVRKDTKRQT